MRYILLAAGRGTRLNPLTKKVPKCLYKLGNDMTIAQRMINSIKKYDKNAEIIMVIGFMSKMIKDTIKGAKFICNPFFECTNSIASLWFAKDYIEGDVTIINSDVVIDSNMMKDIVTNRYDYPIVLLDSSIKKDGDYNVQVKDDKVVVMSKELTHYYGEYVGISKLDEQSSVKLKKEIENMINAGYYNQWYENALVQMIFDSNFELKYKDVTDYNWTEVDCVDDLLVAKEISSKNI